MARSVIAATLSVLVIGALALATAPLSVAQGNAAAGATNPDPANSTTNLSDAQLGDLVGRIALYPDDLLALILPASTVPLEIVQAQRFLKEAEGKKDPQPPESLSEPVRNLLNYPEIIDQMNNDLAWTQQLGEAVYDDQQAVMDAVQRFRMLAYSAGNLKSDDKQKVEVIEQTVVIEPAKPDVIYVPRYEPTKVIYVSSYPVWGYWPTPYPVYYYPYPPGYAFARGVFWGATAAWAFNWHHGGIGWGRGWHNHNNININRNTNININRPGGGNSGSWRPGNGGGHGGNRPTTRPGDAGFRPNIDKNRPATGAINRPGAGAGSRPAAGAGTRPSTGAGGSNFNKPSTRPATRPTNSAGLRPSTSPAARSNAASSRSGSSSRASSPRASSYGGMSGRQAQAASQRGQASRGGSGQRSGGQRGGGGRRR